MGFGKGKGFTEIEYPRLIPTTLYIPEPEVSYATAEDHSGGGFTDDETLTIPEPSISVEAALT
uniref:Uncharacterized protein n=1 Tax=viral metagenome TaxID=1070528 RepID=A0A6M3Y0G0_9ZZZZ